MNFEYGTTAAMPRYTAQLEWLSPGGLGRAAGRRAAFLAGLPGVVHRDQRGTISILAVPTLLMFTILLGMVLNVGRHVDDKVKMQNASDAATYSAGVVLARGMNTIAFCNHLISDVFALTATMREARDRNAESQVPAVLQAWTVAAPIFGNAQLPQLKGLSPAIGPQTALEQKTITAFGNMSAGISKLVLPILEYVLQAELIPNFQRAVVRMTPGQSFQAMTEVARRHGLNPPQEQQQRGNMAGVFWRIMIPPPDSGMANESNPQQRMVPAIDPSPQGPDYGLIAYQDRYLEMAIDRRASLARNYLQQWTDDRLQVFKLEGKFSQFYRLWMIFTCGQLQKLLAEYPQTNLPHILRFSLSGVPGETLRKKQQQQMVSSSVTNPYLEADFMFIGTVYRPQFKEFFPGLFKNALASTSMAFSQVFLFTPEPRLWQRQWKQHDQELNLGGTFGVQVMLDLGPAKGPPPQNQMQWTSDGWPREWDLFNQNWTVQLVPATASALETFLQHPPPAAGRQAAMLKLPNLGGLTPSQLRQVNTH